jgi:hypothetical protein
MMSYKIGLRDGPFLFFNLSGDTLANSQFKSGSGRSFFKCPDTPNPICDDTTWVSGLIDDTLIHRNTRQGLELQEQWTLGTKTFQKNYRNGILISQGGFKNQKRHGEWQVWFEHGVLKNKLNYQDGQMLGEQIFYDSTGAIVMSKHHQGPNQKIIVKFGDKIQLNHQQDSQNQAGD